MHQKRIAIVILNWNGKNYLEKFLPSVEANSSGSDVGIFVADNGSTDDSVSFLKNHFPAVQLILLEKNYGFAEGYNLALKEIEADYFILLNSDVEVTQGWLMPIIEYMDSNPNVAACMPKIRSFAGRDYFEYAGAAGGFLDKFGYPFCRGRIMSEIEKDNNQYNDIKDIFWASGASMFVRASIFNEVNGLDGDFFAHMEEIDLCWRMKNRGYSIRYFGHSTVYHVGGGTLPNNNPRKLFFNYRNNLLLLAKNLAPGNLIPILVLRMIFDGLSASVYLCTFQLMFFLAVFKAHIGFYRMLPNVLKKRKELNKFNAQYKHQEIFNRSIIYYFFILNKRNFNELNFYL